MAEVKNAFIKSKMNLDLDARLVPQGEYRQGFNIQVSKSEGDDVGALENVLGNALLPEGNFQALESGSLNLQAIGHIVNPINDTVYIFLTTNTEDAYDNTASNFIYAYNTLTQKSVKLVEGAFLNFSTKNPIYGINIVENLLFWTDNRNQPRKINIEKEIGYYTTEDHVSVAKFAPFEAIILYQESSVPGDYETTMKDVVSPNLPNGTTINPYLNTSYPGDPDYLEDKFVRFSYRFKFDDNEYSVLAPFTQECFIPKQDGYFMVGDEEATFRSTVVDFMENKVNEITLYIPLPRTADNTTQITGATLFNNLKVTEIDILYKESDGQAVQVVDTLLVNKDFETANSGSTVKYVYQCLKPYKTLPEADLIRVYDKVPVKALSQEISGNRVIYGNFQDKHSPIFRNLEGQDTSQLDYQVGAFDKYAFNLTKGNTSEKEYPNSTLKQNRNYQVGIVVSDRYGRSSTVLLSEFSSISTTPSAGSGTFAASTHFHPYRTNGDTAITQWPGDSLKILFNSPITPSSGAGIPGLYKGSATDPSYNPLGWYSYKVVVKQTEQEYYNVYLPGILNGPPDTVATDDPANTVGFITLINDNVNKVPRDLSEVGPEQKQFRSSVQLFGRVTPDAAGPPTYNQQFYPGIQSNTVITIAEEDDLFGSTTPLNDIYDTLSNPLVGRISQIASNPIGNIKYAASSDFQLGVFETTPVESRLDIYYETSTSGLIADLNAAIEDGGTGASANGATTHNTTFNENQPHTDSNGAPTNVDITTPWAPVIFGEPANQDLPANKLTASIAGVTSLSGEENQTTFFTVVEVPSNGQPYNNQDENTWYRYKIQTTKDFYYGPGAETKKIYTVVVNFTDVSGAGAGSAEFKLPLANTSPIFKTYTIPNNPTVSIDPLPSNLVLQLTEGSTGVLATFTGVNGTADTSLNTENLTWSITSPANQTIFNINAAGELSTSENTLTGPYPITITLTDAGGPAQATSLQLTVLFGNEQINQEFGANPGIEIARQGGDSGAIYFVDSINNAAGSKPLPGNTDPLSNKDIRAPYSDLDLSTTLSNGPLQRADLNAVPGCTDFAMSNTNYNSMYYQPAGTDTSSFLQSNSGLKQGTAFITVNINFLQFDYNTAGLTSGFPVIMYPIYLQYRISGGGDTWQQATDIEGKPIYFGGSQINRLTGFPTSGDVAVSGIINQRNRAEYFDTNSSSVNFYPSGQGFGTNIDKWNCLEANTQVRNLNGPNQNTIASKTFVIGKSPYSNIADKFGDYRLIVRYPFGISSSTGTSEPIVIGPGTVNCPSAAFNLSMGMVRTSVAFGDFYYPPFPENTGTYSYSYNISTVAQNTPKLASQQSTGLQTVFAREWHMKYVSKFYTNEELTEEWVPSGGNAGWFAYTPAESDSLNAKYGTGNSNTQSTGAPALTHNTHRKWVAYFDSTGQKSLITNMTAPPNPPGEYPSLATEYQGWNAAGTF